MKRFQGKQKSRAFRVAAAKWALVLAALVCVVSAQVPQPLAPSSVPVAVVPNSFVLGPGDLVVMQVLDSPELNATMRVDSDGTIHIPFGATPVVAAGKRLDELRGAVAAALVKDQLSIDPKVDLNVAQVESRPVVVTGAVRNPITLQAVEPIRLLDALSRAGGLLEFAGAQIVITSTGPGGPQSETLPAAKVLASDDPALNPLLTGGEEVRVLPGGRAYVNGGVRTAGAFPLNDSDPLTVSKAVTLAGGFSASASPAHSFLIHDVGGQRTIVPVDVKAIMNRKAPDVRLAANDMLMVGDSTTKKVGIETLKATSTALTFAVGTILADRY